MNGKKCMALSCVWHVQWSENKVELFAPNWKFVASSRDSGQGVIFESIAKTMNAAAVSKFDACAAYESDPRPYP